MIPLDIQYYTREGHPIINFYQHTRPPTKAINTKRLTQFLLHKQIINKQVLKIVGTMRTAVATSCRLVVSPVTMARPDTTYNPTYRSVSLYQQLC